MGNIANPNKYIYLRKYPEASLNWRPHNLSTGTSNIQRIFKDY